MLSLIALASVALQPNYDDISRQAAIDVACSFVRRVVLCHDAELIRVEKEEVRVPTWVVSLSGNDTQYYVWVRRGDGGVKKFLSLAWMELQLSAAREGENAFLTEKLAKNAIQLVFDSLKLPGKFKFERFKQNEEVVGRDVIQTPGDVSGAYYALFCGFKFVDRSIRVSIVLDVKTGDLVNYNSTLDAAPSVGSVKAGGVSVEEAETVLVRHINRGENLFAKYLKEKGWYLPDGKTTARLGWRFMKDNKSPSAYIVDIHSQDIYRVRGRKSIKISG